MLKKILISLTFTVCALVAFGFYMTPKQTVIINAPIEYVWEYASDSSKANEWSVFFNHISPLPGIEDGKVGSVRRCYRFEDNTGPTWDEEVVKVIPQKHRELRTYNLQNFKEKGAHKAAFKVFQDYKPISEQKTALTFTTFAENPFNIKLMLQLIPSSFETKRIFKYNLNNMKAAIEARYKNEEYKRPHPFENQNRSDKVPAPASSRSANL